MKEITHEDASTFWAYLAKEYPEIDHQLKSKVFLNGAILSNQPARMKDEDYKQYEGILKTWLTENGFM